MKDKLAAIFIKLIFTFFAGWLAFGYIGNNTFGWIILTSLAVCILNYFIFDIIVLPSFGNMAAAIGEGIIGAITAFLISLLSGGIKANNQIVNVFRTNFLTLAFFAIVIAVIEYFFHIYLLQSGKISSKKDYYK